MDLRVDDNFITPAAFVGARVMAVAILVTRPTRPGHEFRWRRRRQVEAIVLRQRVLVGRRRVVQQLSDVFGLHVDQQVTVRAHWWLEIVADHRRWRKQPVREKQSPERSGDGFVVPTGCRQRRTTSPRFRVVRPVRRTTLPDGDRGDVIDARTAADHFDCLKRLVSDLARVIVSTATAAGNVRATFSGSGGRSGARAEHDQQDGGDTRSDGIHRVRTLLHWRGGGRWTP